MIKKIIRKINVLVKFGQENGSIFYKLIVALIFRRLFLSFNDVKELKSVAFLMPTKGIGDGIIFSGLLHYFHKNNIKVIVVCAERNVFFYEALSSVDVVIPYSDNIHNENVESIFSDKIDFSIDMYGDDLRTPQRLKCLYYLKAKRSIAFNGNGVSRACFSDTINYNELDKHLTDRARYLFEKMRLPVENIPYKIDFPQTSIDFSDGFLSTIKGRIISFAPFASNFNRSLSIEKSRSLALKISEIDNVSLIILGSKIQIDELSIKKHNIHMLPEVGFLDACALIDKSELLLSVDTSFVHMANFFQKRAIALYNKEMWDEFTINIVFGPGYEKAKKIVADSYLVRDIDELKIIDCVKSELKV